MSIPPVKPRRLILLVLASVLCCVASAHACEPLQFDQAWVREPPPVSKVAAAYVAITNPGAQPAKITGIQSDCCGHVMIHDTVVENGKARMIHQDELKIAPNSTVTLAPLGTHIMLMGAETAITAGDALTIVFSCDNDQQTGVAFPVIKK